MINLLHGDCLEQMKTLDDNSVDAIVSDPPYGISFMSKKWDYDVPSVEVWKEAMRVLKPGGHALIACGTRTQHRMVVNIEDAGFEIRDVVSWIYGSGFPKSLNVSKQIDKAAGAEREVVGTYDSRGLYDDANRAGNVNTSGDFLKSVDSVKKKTAPATDAAKQWDGWGTALKPSCEFFTLCRKPLSESTIAKNVLRWGTGGINIDGCRVGAEEITISHKKGNSFSQSYKAEGKKATHSHYSKVTGRFPANLIHSGEQEVLELFPETKSGAIKPSKHIHKGGKGSSLAGSKDGSLNNYLPHQEYKSDQGSAARFFYCAKASKKDRNEGCDELEKGNNHATVKPTALMSYLCRLITPPNGVVLDPYMGSGSTGKAAIREGFSFVGMELDPDYYEIAKARVNHG
jgi:site-specific DNA-methyltransferase (adenine-specific)